MNPTLRYFPLSIVVVLLDQLSKYLAYSRLRTGTDIQVIKGFFKLSYTENAGIAFGIFSNSSGELKVWALAAVSVIAMGLVVYFSLNAVKGNHRLFLIALMLILGGIAGNLIDRIHLHAVIDFIELYVGDYHWPTFNIADAAICVGAGLLSIDILKDSKEATAAAVTSDEQPKEGA